MSHKLFDFKTNSSSRHFAELPETIFFDKLREIAKQLEGATEAEFLTDWVTTVWLDFEFHEHQFSINNQFGSYWFFVENPNCPDEILFEVIEHFQKFLSQ